MRDAPVLYGPNGQALPPGIGKAVAQMMGGRDLGRHAGGPAQRQALDGWRPAQTSADSGWTWNRDLAVSRTRDLLAQEPLAQGGMDRKLDMLVGDGWRPSIKPDADVLGCTPDEAAILGKSIERHFRTWAEDPLCRCDVEQTLNFSWLLHMAVMEQEVSGDALAVLRWKPGRGWDYGAALQVVDSDRLSNPMMTLDTDRLRQGVEKDLDGAPVAYHIRNAHPGDLGIMAPPGKLWTWERVERRLAWGRPQVLHLFRKERPGQTRGVSKLVASLARFKNLQRFADTELANAVVNAMFAATITSSFDPAIMQGQLTDPAIAGYHDLRSSFYDVAAPTMGGARIQALFPGDTLDFNATPRPTAAFESFTTVFLRAIASGLGISYEQLTTDYSKVNYSSARASLLEVWRGIQTARSLIALQLATPILLAITEEGLDSGAIEAPALAPDLYEAPAAWLRGRWLGPARGWVDPVKEPLGAVAQIEAGFGTFEDAAADQGNDLELVIAQLKREAAMFKAAGLTPPAIASMLALNDATDVMVRETLSPA